MTIVYLDVDGVLADFSAGWLEMAEEETGWRHGTGVVTHWNPAAAPFFADLAKAVARDPKELERAVWKRVNRIGFCSALSVTEGARGFVSRLREIQGVEVEYVTSPLLTSPTWVPERLEWLNRHFGATDDQVHFSKNKARYAGDMLLDDKPENVAAWSAANPGKTALLWHAPYNYGSDAAPGLRVRSWREVLEAAKYVAADRQLATLTANLQAGPQA